MSVSGWWFKKLANQHKRHPRSAQWSGRAHARYRDGITLGTLEELVFAAAQKLNAPEIDPEPQRPGGYEETGFVTRDIPGVGVSIFSSPAPASERRIPSSPSATWASCSAPRS